MVLLGEIVSLLMSLLISELFVIVEKKLSRMCQEHIDCVLCVCLLLFFGGAGVCPTCSFLICIFWNLLLLFIVIHLVEMGSVLHLVIVGPRSNQ